MKKECYLCHVETDGHTTWTTLPKELLDKDENGNRFDDPQPLCRKCYNFKRAVDTNFTNLCADTRLYELYRANSNKRGVFFPTELVYNVDKEKLRELYDLIINLCEVAENAASDDTRRQDIKDELNYEWRKKDE